jgi:predicted anti-sigma-YlaC factor YlaD
VSIVRRNAVVVAGLMAAFLMASSCSTRKLAANMIGDALAKGSSSWASDDDPELVRDATPFALKTIESLLTETPNHRALLLAAASGFTQYAYAFVQCEADYLESSDLARSTAMRERAVKLYVRAQGYGWRAIEVAHPGLRARLRTDGASALSGCTRSDVPLLYWTAAPLAAAVSLAKQNAELAAELPTVEILMNRALALDEGFGDGAIHDFFIAYDGGRPPSAGGSPERARQHFEQSIAISGGRLAAPLVSYAESVLVGAQNRAEFVKLLERALTVDPKQAPAQQLANLVAQKRARWLLARVGDFFIE